MSELYLGLISGTSVDAVDVALVDFSDPQRATLVATLEQAPPADLREQLLAAARPGRSVELKHLGELDQRVANWFAEAANRLLESQPAAVRNELRAVGSHGQTLIHGADGTPPFTLQIGDPSRIARRTGYPTVGYFRQADMAAGGQGAPLATAFHAEFLRHSEHVRAVLNLGGIANLTYLPQLDSDDPVTGFDTGPSNALLDAWINHHQGLGRDDRGAWGQTGSMNVELLEKLLDEDYLKLPPPKSTGREYFNLDWARTRAGALLDTLPPADVMRSFYELTAVSIARALETNMPDCQEVLLCGGGAHNPLLTERLQANLGERIIDRTDNHGVPGDWVEAATFAWLAMRRIQKMPGNLPSVTGAEQAAVLGGLYLP